MSIREHKPRSSGFLRSHTNLISPQSTHQVRPIAFLKNPAIPLELLTSFIPHTPTIPRARISPIDEHYIEPSAYQTTNQVESQTEDTSKAMVLSTQRSSQHLPLNQAAPPSQAMDPRKSQNPRTHTDGQGNPPQQGKLSSQAGLSSPQDHQKNPIRGATDHSTRVNHHNRPPPQEADVHNANNRLVKAQDYATYPGNVKEADRIGNNSSGLPRGNITSRQTDNAHKQDTFKVNMLPPPRYGNKGIPLAQPERQVYHGQTPAQTTRTLPREQAPMTHEFRNDFQAEEEFDELGEDYDNFEEPTPVVHGVPHTDAARIRPEYPFKSSNSVSQSSSRYDTDPRFGKTSHGHQSNRPEDPHTPIYLGRNIKPSVNPPRRVPTNGYNSYSMPGRPSFDDELGGVPSRRIPMEESVLTFDETGQPVTPERQSGRDESTFNFTPSAKDPEADEDVVPEPEARFKIPVELEDPFALIRSFIDREKVFEGVLKYTGDPKFQPTWATIKEGHTKLSSSLNSTHHHFESIEGSLTKLVEIKDKELERKIGLTKRYAEAGSDLSEHCSMMQLTTRNNVKRRKVEMEVD
ncbi:hypothetical protein I203_102132 [Kwoniella mangroviensis CBS 8507]|uniref:uncharacterized protein n=1 Tax=Kwoniella mangroviensis CBS 8507 TaxID=1296122 RepID=UPI00080D6DA4|nr:uncharacterized protein I203_03327 [Kwoniella mangroviensis CBS 8507]OCF67630.1 hypothetical protein I203_03327 [Kwoniella mangroviensis CBS 8507]